MLYISILWCSMYLDDGVHAEFVCVVAHVHVVHVSDAKRTQTAERVTRPRDETNRAFSTRTWETCCLLDDTVDYFGEVLDAPRRQPLYVIYLAKAVKALPTER